MIEVLAKALCDNRIAIHVSNQHIVHLKLTQCYISIISQLKKKKGRTCDWEAELGQEFEESLGIKKGTVGVVNDSVEALRS